MPRFIIHILLTLCLTASVNAQTASIDSDFEQLIEKLCSKYKVKIGYSAELLNMNIPEFSEADLEKMSVTELLDHFFSKEGLSYRMVDGDKILLRKDDVQLYQESLRTISGKILDGESGFPLPYASIYMKRSTVGTMSDLRGQFSIEVPDIPTVELVVSYLGYKARNLNISNLSSHEVIHLIPSEEVLEEVTIIVDPMVIIDVGKNNQITLNKNRLVEVTAGEVYGSDILRSIQMLPGVSNDADAAGKIQLRGSDAEETLVVLDGIPLYKTDHYYGIFGAINPYYIEDATLYKNKIPLEYENRAGGMLLLNSTDYIKNTNGNIELDFLKANAYVELPISSKVGLLIGGRFNHTDPFNSPLSENDDNVNLNDTPIDMVSFQRSKLIDVQPKFKFYDLNAKLNLNLTSKLSFSISTFGSSDKYLRTYDIRYIAENRQGKKGLIDESVSNTEKWRNQGINLSGSYNFQPDKALKWSVFNSTYKNDYSLGLSLSRVFRVGEVEFFSYDNVNYNEIRTGGIRLQYVKDNDWHVGVSLQNRENVISVKEVSSNKGSNTPIDRLQMFGEGAIFGKKTFYPSEDLEIGLGVRMNLLEAFDTMTLSPLIELKYEPSPGHYLKASYAKLYQNFRELTFENRLGGYQQYFVLAQEELYPLGYSNLYMVGGGVSLGVLRMDVEFFRKDLGGTIALLPVLAGLQDDVGPDINVKFKLFSGRSQSRGVDVYLGYDSPRIFSQLAYTYSKTEDIFDNINRGEPFPSQNDRRHQLKWLNAVTVGKFIFSGSTVFSSGRPYISFDKFIELGRTRNRLEEALVNLPAYLRLDVGIRYELKVGGLDTYIKGSVYNLLNRQNVRFIEQSFSVPISTGDSDEVIIGSESSLVDRLFNITLGLNF